MKKIIYPVIKGYLLAHIKRHNWLVSKIMYKKISGAQGSSGLTTTIYFVHTFISDSRQPGKHTPGKVG